MSSPSLSLRDGRSSETRARVKITPREKGETRQVERKGSPFTHGVIFTRACVLFDLLSLRENEGLLVLSEKGTLYTSREVIFRLLCPMTPSDKIYRITTAFSLGSWFKQCSSRLVLL